MSFQWVRQIGGSGAAATVGVATDAQDNIYVAGNTTSVDMPVTGASQAHPGGSGLFRIDPAGGAWTNLFASGATSVNWFAVSARNPKLILAAAQSGILRSTDGGATWTLAFAFTQSPLTVAFDPTNDSLAYAAGGGWFLNSFDGGVTWGGVGSGPGGSIPERIWVDPNSPQVLFVANSGGLQRNANQGRVGWQGVAGFSPLSLAFDPFTPGTIYALTYNSLELSVDDGLHWSLLTPPDSSALQSLVADPLHKGSLYASSYNGVYRSQDSGITWTPVAAYLNAGPMAIDPATAAVYVGVGGNVYVSADGFATSRQIGPAATAAVQALAVAGAGVFEGVAASTDAFVVKYDSTGNIVYSTYFGGSGQDEARGMALDPNGAVYVMGVTYSVDFPVTPGTYSNSGKCFLFKLNPDGSLAYSTRFSIGTAGLPNAIAVDSAGHAYVAGTTEGGLTVTPGAYQITLQGTEPPPTFFLGPPLFPVTNGFLMRFDAAGAALVFSTYFGNQNATGDALAIEPDGGAVVSGQGSIYRFDPTGSALLASQTIPPSIASLATDSSGKVYAVGGTGGRNVAATPGALYAVVGAAGSLPGNMGNTGAGDVFVSEFDPNLNLIANAVFGGEAADLAQGVSLASNGNVIVVGSTYSQGFPTRGTAQSAFSPSTGFVAELAPDLASLVVSTYAGDTRMFNALSAAATIDGAAVFTGSTQAPSYANDGSGYASFDGDLPSSPATQAYVVSTSKNGTPVPRIDSVSSAADRLAIPLTAGETFLVTGADFGPGAVVMLNGTAVPLLAQSASSLTAAVPMNFTAPGGTVTVTVQSAGGSASIVAPFASAAPAVYSIDGSGFGQGYILNADGTPNSPSNPALEGSKVTIFATGVGPLTFQQGYAVTKSDLAVLIDGFWANGIDAVFAPAPGLPGNVYQVSVYVPQPSLMAAQNPNLTGFHLPPQVAVTLEIGGAKSQAGLSISVTH